MTFIDSLLLGIGVGLIVFYLHLQKKQNKVLVMYGYPKNKTTWLTLYHDRSKDKWIYEWDDLFAPDRPKDWYPLSMHCMYFEEEGAASIDEYRTAMRLLEERGYI